MRLKRRQSVIIISCITVLILMSLFPPWYHSIYISTNQHVAVEITGTYAFAFCPPEPLLKSHGDFWIAHIDFSRLFIQWVLVALLTVGIVLLLERLYED